MAFINSIIGYPLGWIMWFFYQLVHNYGIALILFTIATRLIMLPSSIKQQKSMVKMQMFQPKIAELQKKYANNRQKLNEEMAKLYEKEGYNPMSGCLPMALPLILMFGLIDVVYKPLTYILRIPADLIDKATGILAQVRAVEASSIVNPQLEIFSVLKSGAAGSAELVSGMGQSFVDQVNSFDYTFLGIDLWDKPSWAFNVLLLIPILSAVTSFLLSMISMRNSPSAAQMGGGMKGMMYAMPLMSVWISFTVPAGVGLYWIFTNVVMGVQTLFMYKYYNPKDLAEKAQQEAEAKKEAERQAKLEARRRAQELGIATPETMSQKELNRLRLKEARIRMAEKYGDEYHPEEDTDEPKDRR